MIHKLSTLPSSMYGINKIWDTRTDVYCFDLQIQLDSIWIYCRTFLLLFLFIYWNSTWQRIKFLWLVKPFLKYFHIFIFLNALFSIENYQDFAGKGRICDNLHCDTLVTTEACSVIDINQEDRWSWYLKTRITLTFFSWTNILAKTRTIIDSIS